MGRPDFQSLHVYKAAEELADEVWKIVLTWRPLARSTVGIQLARAADSVGANIAEGTGRTTYPDNRRFAGMARGSLYETIHWLRRAYKRQLLKPEQVDKLTQMTDNLAPRLNAYLKSIGKGPKGQKLPPNNN
jgi:four helix bundle protein